MAQVLKSLADLGTALNPGATTGTSMILPDLPRASPPLAQEPKSGSSRIKAYLIGLEINFPELTTPEISERVGTSHGATSGFMAKLKASGVAEVAGKRNGQFVYRIDRQKLTEHNVRTNGSGGSEKGRRCGGHRTTTAGLPDLSTESMVTPRDLVATLAKVSEALSNMPAPKTLADFTTEELVDEVHRRVHAAKGV